MKLQKIKYLMIGIGFFWIFCSTVLGSLLGAKINSMSLHDQNGTWIYGLQKMLLVSAHSHMNLMSMVTIIIGLSLGMIWGKISKSFLMFAISCNLIAMPVFVLGILCKALFMLKNGILFTSIMALGAILYIISVGLLSAMFLFIFASYKSNDYKK